MTHLETKIADLTARMEALEAELAGRKRGLALAHDESGHYETAWEQENGKLKGHLKRAVAFIQMVGSDGDDVQRHFIQELNEAIGEKVGLNEFEIFDAEVTMDILGLVTEHEIPYETVACWTREQKQEAEAWAAQQHAIASDNELDEPLFKKPAHVVELEKNNPKRSEIGSVALTPHPMPTEPPYVT